MDITAVLSEIRRRLNLTKPQLSLMLGFSETYIWLLEEKHRRPSISACKKIIKFAKENAYFSVKIEMLRDDLRF